MTVHALKPQGELPDAAPRLTMLETQVGKPVPAQSASELQGIPHAEPLDVPQMGGPPVGREKQPRHVSGHWSAHVRVGGDAGTASAMQAPLRQAPPAQAVPAGLGLHLPFLHRLQGPHFFFLHLASASAKPSRASGPPRASPLRSLVMPRRVVLPVREAVRERVKPSNEPSSTRSTFRYADAKAGTAGSTGGPARAVSNRPARTGTATAWPRSTNRSTRARCRQRTRPHHTLPATNSRR
jgi:hypothetical protein